MTDLAIPIGLRPKRVGDAAAERFTAAFRRELMIGLKFSTRVRSVALGAIAILVVEQNWESGVATTLYFEAGVALFFLFGIGHYQVGQIALRAPRS